MRIADTFITLKIMMEIKNDIIYYYSGSNRGCLVYIEQIPQISACGSSVAEAMLN
jgi:hypothetical protein